MNPKNQSSIAFFLSAIETISQQVFLLVSRHKLELFVAYIAFIIMHSRWQKKCRGLPVWPLLGMLPSLINGLRTDVHEMFTEVLGTQNWTYTFKGPWFSSLDAVITSDPRNVEYLLKTNFANFPKGESYYALQSDILGDGIFNTDGESWRQQRKVASVYFHSVQFQNMMDESLTELVHSHLLPILEDFIKQSKPFDLQDVLLRFTFDNICILALGVDPGCLRPDLPDIPFAKAVETATEAMMKRFNTPMYIWKTMRHLQLGWERKVKKSIKQIDEFAEEVIHSRRKELASNLAAKKSSSNLLTVFMKSKDNQEKPFTDKYLRDICLSFTVAGRDTTSVALTWFFWLLNRHPLVEEHIFAEVSHIISTREHCDTGGKRNLTFQPEEIKKMDYLQAALSESLRLYPSLPLDIKEVLQDDVLPNGTKLKKGIRMIYSIYTMGRMEDIWGKDCREFKPERWLRDGKFISESPYKFIAFNAGPRLCLGKDFSYYQMKFIAASIIYRYRVKVAENHPVTYKTSLTYYMKYGLKVTLNHREKDEV